MSLKIKWITSEGQFELNELGSLFLFPIVIKLDLGLNRKDTIEENELVKLETLLLEEIDDLFTYRYKEPSEKSIQKRPSRFEKINHRGTIRKVDYRTDDIGSLIFNLSNLLNSVQSSNKNGTKLDLIIEKNGDQNLKSLL